MKASIISLSLLVLVVGLLGLLPTQEMLAPVRADGFASDRFPENNAKNTINASRVMGYLRNICDLGPRITGSEGMKKQQELLAKHFKTMGATVEFQKTTALQASQPRPLEIVNLIARWHPRQRRRVLICAHYDTRPRADEEPLRQNRLKPFIAANDGGSGVAMLMELAHHMKDLPTKVGVDFVLFDAEECIYDTRRDRYFLGSQHFADVYRKRLFQGPKYVAGILVDMIAGKNPRFPIEKNSWFLAGQLVREIWTIAKQQKCTCFESHRMSRVAVQDDHLPLNRAGIPTIDIIDFDYPHWHRLSDTPMNCSSKGMKQVGNVILTWLQQVK